jgi:hypothetical protein
VQVEIQDRSVEEEYAREIPESQLPLSMEEAGISS